MSSDIRVRFAPSPTGQIHIGNVRTAILNWLFARHTDGVFVLRIEDTDAERSTEESEKSIIEQLSWFGLDWDEGPVKGGGFGPYRQSERLQTYREHVDRLLASEHAYRCYCTKEELEEEREKALTEKRSTGYSGKCRNLTAEREAAFRQEGRRPVIRFRVPEGPVNFSDLVQGDMHFDSENISDFVIQREDGSSPYNFAVVVDDALMKISHVIRGNDHVSNTPKQVLLFHALGYDLPQFAHIPMILGQDGTRLSKRHGHTSLGEYRTAGYLPETLLNYLSLLSWSSETGDEILSGERLINEFSFSRISRSPAQFDPVKLSWMNGVYIRSLTPEKRMEYARPYLEAAGMIENNTEKLGKIIESVRDKVETLADFPRQAELFFKDTVSITGGEEKELLSSEDSRKVLILLRGNLEKIDQLTVEAFLSVMKDIQKDTGIKGKNLWMPVRVALTGQMHGPELQAILEIFGRDRCIRQLDFVLAQ